MPDNGHDAQIHAFAGPLVAPGQPLHSVFARGAKVAQLVLFSVVVIWRCTSGGKSARPFARIWRHPLIAP